VADLPDLGRVGELVTGWARALAVLVTLALLIPGGMALMGWCVWWLWGAR
jgi:hypothetical protein